MKKAELPREFEKVQSIRDTWGRCTLAWGVLDWQILEGLIVHCNNFEFHSRNHESLFLYIRQRTDIFIFVFSIAYSGGCEDNGLVRDRSDYDIIYCSFRWGIMVSGNENGKIRMGFRGISKIKSNGIHDRLDRYEKWSSKTDGSRMTARFLAYINAAVRVTIYWGGLLEVNQIYKNILPLYSSYAKILLLEAWPLIKYKYHSAQNRLCLFLLQDQILWILGKIN